MTYMISYDLHAPGQNYTKLEEAILRLGKAKRLADSTWLLIHPGPAETIRDYLVSAIDDNDRLIVMEFAGEIAWFGISPTLELWLRLNL